MKHDKLIHLLCEVYGHGEEFYLEQIEDIILHYGDDAVLKAELFLASTSILERLLY